VVIGAIGYHYLAGLSWSEAFGSAALVRFSFAPVPGAALLSASGRLFAWFHALWCGIVLLTIAGAGMRALLQLRSSDDPPFS
jgi:hypothetical protein